MNNSDKIISIIIPVYNVEEYLAECFESILDQKIDLSKVEVIIVDDGSTDNSSEIGKKFSERYPILFKYYNKRNGGLSEARNFGVQKATGDYLIFLDGDDKLNKDILYDLIPKLEKNKYDLIVLNYQRFIDEILLEKEVKWRKEEGVLSSKDYLVMPPSACNKVIKRKIFVENKLSFPQNLWYEDRGLTGMYVFFVDTIYFINKTLILYRQRPDSITHRPLYTDKFLDIFPIMENVYKIYEKNNEYKDEIEFLFIEHLLVGLADNILIYKKYDEMEKAVSWVSSLFPKFFKNKYISSKSWRYRVLVYLLRARQYKLIGMILRRKLR